MGLNMEIRGSAPAGSPMPGNVRRHTLILQAIIVALNRPTQPALLSSSQFSKYLLPHLGSGRKMATSENIDQVSGVPEAPSSFAIRRRGVVHIVFIHDGASGQLFFLA